ncbi:MAG: hypothetical protein A4E53_00487 [Pelotomaculum sp. PtaB.Bin104]|jgi:hypothetical protein|nr:MAG: hypothetical protein A4E53_00487 [Pelotomaculum sp. PtaB.Bin104]
MALETRPTSEKENSIQEFTVHFWKDRVILDGENLPMGQISTDVLNLSEEQILALRYKANETYGLFRTQLYNPEIKKDLALVTAMQDKLNEYLDIILAMPPFKYLDVDTRMTHNTLTVIFEETPDDFQRILQQGTFEFETFYGFLRKVFTIPDELISLRVYVTAMLDFYFERLKKRNEEYYAVGVYDFFSNKEIQRDISASFPPAPVYQFRQSRQALIEYTTMPNPDDAKKYIIAERMVFTSIASFLHADFFKGLMNGNTPRRCHNCKRFFLLSSGYDTCYCNNIAPGETEKTCRKVGAHKKQASKEGKTPARQEYKKVYNKLKTRRARGKISIDEWNAAVALALEYKDKAEAGKITDLELKAIYDKM